MSDLSLGGTRRTLSKARCYDVFIVGRVGDSEVTVLHEVRLSDAVKRSEAWLAGQSGCSIVEIWLEGVVCVWARRADTVPGYSEVESVGLKPHWPLSPGRHRWRSKTDDWVRSGRAISRKPATVEA